ncbi:MAG: AarF/UbiB family protein [Bacilli bacterium]|nr:AarF/UbiB family protein [Bacilli bacterium]
MNEKDRLKEILSVLKNNNILGGLTPSKLYKIMEELGPTFIKIGQIMSNRNDIFPKEYCDELSRLRSDVTPMSFSDVEDILIGEYGDYKDIFKDIDVDCIGSASIAQVHRATLKNGDDVVVKIKRKNIYNKMALDVKLLKKAISIMHLNNIFKVINLSDVIEELFNVAKEEMDFVIEAKHIEEFNDNNKDISYVRAPYVYKDISTSKVLVMENIKGVTIDKVDILDKKYNMEDIGLKLANNYVKQAIVDGFFHADPHPDNIMLLDNKIVFLDLGMMGRISSRERELLDNCISAIVKNDVYEVERILLLLSTTVGDVDHIKLRKDIEMILSKNASLEIHNTNTLEFINDMFSMLRNNNIRLDKDITMLIRGIGIIEGVLEKISPNISLIEVLSSRVEDDVIDDVISKDNIIKVGKDIINMGNGLINLPDESLKLVKSINRGEVNFKIELNDSEHKIDKLEAMLHLIVVGLLDASLLLGASIVDSIFLRNIYLGFACVLSIWLVIRMYIDYINKG